MASKKLWEAVLISAVAGLLLGGCGGGGGGGSSEAGTASPSTGASSGGSQAASPLPANAAGTLKSVLSIQVTGNGTVATNVDASACTSNCSATVNTDTLVTLSATAASGSVFSGWQGVCANSGATCTVTMDAAKSVTALFTAAPARTVCASSFYGSGYLLTVAKLVDTVVSMVKPARGVAFAEPNFQTCMVRASNHAADGLSGFAINDYSRRQAFNADSSKYLIYGVDGSWHVYDAVTYTRIKQLAGLSGDAEPQWNASNPDLLYYLPTNGQGMRLHELTVSTNTSRVVADFSARLKARWPAAYAAWTKSEGSPSKDGRYWCFMVDNTSWNSVGVFTWDRDTDTITGAMNTNGNRPDHVSMSPSGNYCVVSWANASGTVSYSRDFSASRRVHTTSEHSDLAIDANGDDTYVSIDYQSAGGDVFMVNLRTGERTTLLPTYAPGSATALHISGKSFNKPGWVLLSTYADAGSAQWFFKKVLAVQLRANPSIDTLAFHRSAYVSYYTEPHATVNRDFTKVLFTSNWNANTDVDLDAYLIEMPAGS